MFITGTELTAFAAALRTQGHGPATVVKYHREAAGVAAWLGGGEVAGGLREAADPRAQNQARMLSDGEQVTVLTVEEVQNGETVEQSSAGEDLSGVSGASDGGKVNINTADEAGLMTIPGIGESRAKAIIAYREENGKFESIEDIMKIDGIKEKMFDKIKDSITVS